MATKKHQIQAHSKTNSTPNGGAASSGKQMPKKSVPDDKTFLLWVEKAQQTPGVSEVTVSPLPLYRSRRWIPYAAAASIAIGVAIIGLTRTGQSNDGLPVAEEVTVESQTIHFMCNNGCSAQDIMFLANKAIKE